MRSSVTEKGEQGASAIRVMARGRGSWYSRMSRRESARIDVFVLDDVVGGQAALALAAAHRAARGMEADAEVASGGDLGVDQALVPAREQVQVVGGGRAAGEEQLAQADARRHVHRLRVRVPPHLVELDQPSEERRLLHARHVAGERLRQVVVRVDEAGQDDLAAGVQAPVHGVPGRLSRPHGGDVVVFDEDPSAGQTPPRIVHGRDQTGIVDEEAHAFFFYQVSWGSSKEAYLRPRSIRLRPASLVASIVPALAVGPARQRPSRPRRRAHLPVRATGPSIPPIPSTPAPCASS